MTHERKRVPMADASYKTISKDFCKTPHNRDSIRAWIKRDRPDTAHIVVEMLERDLLLHDAQAKCILKVGELKALLDTFPDDLPCIVSGTNSESEPSWMRGLVGEAAIVPVSRAVAGDFYTPMGSAQPLEEDTAIMALHLC